MTDKVEAEAADSREPHRRSRHGFWFGIFAGGLAGLVLGGTLAYGAKAVAASHLGGHRRGGLFRNEDPAEAREHLELFTDWVLSRVEASSDQKEQAKRVVSQTYDELMPLIQEHRRGHESLVEEMTKAELDPEAIERIRLSQIALIDEASKELSSSLTELASVLTPEQRVELVEMAQRLHH